MKDFSTFDIIRIFDIPRERLQDWINRGYIFPSLKTAEGKGTKNIFSHWDLYGIELFQRLIISGHMREIASIYYKSWVAMQSKSTIESFKKWKYLICLTSPIKPSEYSAQNIKISNSGKCKVDKFSNLRVVMTNNINLEEFIVDCHNWESINIINIEEIFNTVDKKVG
ncbi:MAG: hypothetical protein HOC71_16960 [Candidatus Latescibacteria bacterium]|jgi:hypothetical protein|nr:hypothetical protein [Candidatus Latescibacterota bacterium]